MDNNDVSNPVIDDDLEFIPRRARRRAAEAATDSGTSANGQSLAADVPAQHAAALSTEVQSSEVQSGEAVVAAEASVAVEAPTQPKAVQAEGRKLKQWYADYLQPQPLEFVRSNVTSVPRAQTAVTPPIEVDADAPRTITRRTQAVLVPNDPDGDRLKTSRVKAIHAEVASNAEEPSVSTRRVPRRKRNPRAKSHAGQASYEILSWVRMLVIVAAVACVLRLFVFELVYVEGTSMNPTLSAGELVFASKLDYRFGEPQRGDIVICRFPNRDGTFIKRIIGMPGETFQLADGTIYVDGERLEESYTALSLPDDYGPVRIAAGQYIVLGDNRSVSHDSRSDDVGTLSVDKFVGRVHAVVYPFNESRLVDVSAPALVPTPGPSEETSAILAIA